MFFFTGRELFAEFVFGEDESYGTPGLSEWLKVLELADISLWVRLEKGFESSMLFSALSIVPEKLGTPQLGHIHTADVLARPSYTSGLINMQRV